MLSFTLRFVPVVDSGFSSPDSANPIFLPSAISCGKVMFSQASVILYRGFLPLGPGGCLPLGLGGVYPGGVYIWVRGCTPPGHTVPLGRHHLGRPPPEHSPSRQTHPRQTCPPSSETATTVDGTHPTGMHSCAKCFQKKTKHTQWRTQDFSDRGCQSQKGCQPTISATFSQQLHENEKKWTGG